MNSGACGRLPRRPLTGPWFRAIRLKHFDDRLSTEHTRTVGSRFSVASERNPLYRVLHLGETHQVAIHEAGALFGDPAAPVANPTGSWVILKIDVVLDQVVDLCLPEHWRILRTNPSELTGNWRNSTGPAPTQRLGQALFDQPGLEGFLFPSSRVDARCLLVFPDKLGPRSLITFDNELHRRDRPEVLR